MSKPKSAYSQPTKFGKEDHHIIVVWVDNEAGVLARVIGLFSGRGYNIESLAVAEIDKIKHLSRITIVTQGTREVIDQIHRIEHNLYPKVIAELLDMKVGLKDNTVQFSHDSEFKDAQPLQFN